MWQLAKTTRGIERWAGLFISCLGLLVDLLLVFLFKSHSHSQCPLSSPHRRLRVVPFFGSSPLLDLVLVLANIVKIIIILLVVVIVILLVLIIAILVLSFVIFFAVILVLLVVAVFFQKCLQRLAKLPHVAQLPPHHHAHEPTHALEYAARQHRQAAAICWTGLLVSIAVNGAASEHGIAVLSVEDSGIERPL